MRGIYQHDENDCGLACILTICKYYKLNVDETNLRKKIYFGKEGLNLYGIVRVFKDVGVTAEAVEGSLEELYQLIRDEKAPHIVMIEEEHECHYVVAYRQKKDKLLLWDPNRGKRDLSLEKFGDIWTGYAVQILKVNNVASSKIKVNAICLEAFMNQKKNLILLLCFSFILMIVSIATTYLYKDIIEQVEIGVFQTTQHLKYIFWGMAICYLIMLLFSFLKGSLQALVKKDMGIELQHYFVDALFQMPIQKRDDYMSGGILDRYYRVSSLVDVMADAFTTIVLETISMFAGIWILIHIDSKMFLMVLLILITYMVCVCASKKQIYRLSKRILDKESIVVTYIKEMTENLLTLKNLGNSSYERRLKREIEGTKKKEYQLEKISVLLDGILETVENIMMLIVLGYGIWKVMKGEMSLGTLLAFMAFANMFLSPAKNLLGILPSLQETKLTFQRLEDVYAYKDEKVANLMDEITGDLSVSNLQVAYGYDKPILQDISLEIKSGTDVYLLGTSGSGKSSLAKAIAGILDCPEGQVIWKGMDSKQVKNSLQDVLYLPQEAEIFSGTIEENILMWKSNYDKNLFQEVLHGVGIYEMMNRRGLELTSYLAENGVNLSGGERQRIAIARAIMMEAKVYIFDEATCHLDAASEKEILEYLEVVLKNQTCFFIIHNANLLKESDKIIFINSDGLLYFGKHSELLDMNEDYRSWMCG